ncbi:MAG: MCE family protein [Mycobacteriaceae bacterium]
MTVNKPLVGFSMFGVVALLLTSIIWFTLERNVSGKTNSYTAIFSDVSGLRSGDDVRMAGVRVGRVEAVELVDNQAKVSFIVQEDQKIFDNTRALIRYQNLIGQRYIALALPHNERGMEMTSGASIDIKNTEPSFDISLLLNGFEPLFATLNPEQINSLSESIVQAVQGDGASLASLIAQSTTLATTFANKDEVLGSLIENLGSALNQLNMQSTELKSVILQVRKLVEGLNGQSATLGSSVLKIGDAADSLATMLGSIQPSLKTTLDSAKQASVLLTSLGEKLDKTAQDVPIFLAGLIRASQSGTYFALYLCELDVSLYGVLFPPGLFSQIGGKSHSKVCR